MKKEMHVIQSMPKIEDEGLYSYSSEYGSEDEDEPQISGLTKAQISHFPKFKFNNQDNLTECSICMGNFAVGE